MELSIVWVSNPVHFNHWDYNDKKHSSSMLRATGKVECVEELGVLPKKLALINLFDQYATFWKRESISPGRSCVRLFCSVELQLFLCTVINTMSPLSPFRCQGGLNVFRDTSRSFQSLDLWNRFWLRCYIISCSGEKPIFYSFTLTHTHTHTCLIRDHIGHYFEVYSIQLLFSMQTSLLKRSVAKIQ